MVRTIQKTEIQQIGYKMNKAEYLQKLLWQSKYYTDPNEDRNHITGLEHALRVAEIADAPLDHMNAYYDLKLTDERARDEVVFMGLVHDIARPLSDIYHGEVIAEIVRDVVSENVYQALRVHGAYQANLIHGTPVDETTPWHNLSKALCHWEELSFDLFWGVRPTMSFEATQGLIQKICK